MPDDLTFTVVRPGEPAGPLVELAFETVLRPSFVEEELPDVGALIDTATGLTHQTVVIAARAGEPAAVGVSSAADDHGVALLGYLASAPGQRSRGLGAAVLEELRHVWDEAGVRLALGEVHDPRSYPETPGERADARLAFYHRHGAELLDLPWIQPRLAPHLTRVPHMLLISLHRGADLAHVDSLPGRLLAGWAHRYFEDETTTGGPDPERDSLLAHFDRRERVRLLPLTEYHQVEPLGT